MKDALMQLESTIRNDAEGPAVLTSPPPPCSLLSPPCTPAESGEGGRPSSISPPPPPEAGACGIQHFPPPPPSLLLPGVRPPTPPVLRWSERSAFRTFVPRQASGHELDLTHQQHRQHHRHLNGTGSTHIPRSTSAGATCTSLQQQQEQDSCSPPPPLLPAGHNFGGQLFSSPSRSAFSDGVVSKHPDDGEGESTSAPQRQDRHPLAFLFQVARERTKFVENVGEHGQGRQDIFQRLQQASFPELQLDHHEMSKKYKENLKQSQKQNRDDMVRKLDYRGSPSAETRHAGPRFHSRVSNAPFDNQAGNCMMSTSATQTGELGINGNLDSPDLDGPPVPPPPLVTNSNLSSIYHGDWPIDRILWNSAPSSYGEKDSLSGLLTQETSSLMSWSSTGSTTGGSSHGRRVSGSGSGAQPLGTKVEMVYSLLSMLGAHDKEDMSKTLLAMSQSPESCIAMRQSGCLPLLIQLLHGTDEGNGTIPEDGGQAQRARTREARRRASQALLKIVHAQADDKRGRRETRVLRLLEQIREYCDTLREIKGQEAESGQAAEGVEVNAGPAMAALMKLSFDEEHRNAMCQLGGLHAIAELIEVDQFAHGSTSDQFSVTLRRYAGMALTNLTFGDGNNKALLCSMKPFMYALVAQLHSPSEDLRQVMASVLRNLSWRADSRSKQLLREVGAVGALMGAAMEATKESTLKSVLSALWNLSAHCSANKADICSFQGSLAFLVDTLNHPSPAIIENGGGILRNISSHIAVHEEYRTVLRRHNCLQILLEHLKSSSLTVVSNACGTLWNLSARCVEDQKALWDMGAVGMLRNLVHSKHKMISMGSSAALKNLLSANPAGRHGNMAISQRAFGGNNNMPSLMARKQKALEEELDQNLAETCDNIDSPKTSPTHRISLDNRFFSSSNNGNFPPYYSYLPGRMYFSVNGQISNYHVPRSESRESIGSTHSEPIHPHHRTIYHSFSRNSRYVSVDHRYYGYPDFDRTNYFHTNHVTPGRPLSEISHPERLDNSVYNERYMLSSEMKRQSEYLRREAEKNAVLQGNQPEDEQEQPAASTGPDHLVPAHSTGNLRPSKDVREMAKRFEGVSLGSSEVQDQPIDYSCKYVDDVPKVAKKKQVKDALKMKEFCAAKNEQNTQEKSFTSEQLLHHPWQHLNSASFHPYTHKQTKMALRKSGQECTLQHINSAYGGYTETDLDGPDQLTDFSQMYKEHMDTAEDFEAPRTMPEDLKGSAFHDDSLKVYCTEGTPLNFSTASSLTDLREIHLANLDAEANKQNEKSKPKIAFEKPARGGHMKSAAADIDFNKNRTAEERVVKEEEESRKQVYPVKKRSLGEKEATTVPGKSVTFGEEVNYSMETPLMFSRCSSLGSLSSFEQQSIHDDRSSVISDFSRRTSEVVSPSDLPDSPSQTMPPSPHRTKHSPGIFQFPTSHARLSGDALLHFRKARQAGEDSSEDSVKLYADENTPGNISGATSLSSLTIDDQPKIQKERSLSNIHKSPILEEKEEMVVESFDEKDDQDEDKGSMLSPNSSPGKMSSKHDSLQGSSSADNADEVSDTETDEEDMQATYIIPGMSGHHRNNSILHSRINDLGSPSNLKAAKSSLLRIPSPVVKGKVPLAQSSASGTCTSTPVKRTNLDVTADEVKVYQTEGTPSALSHTTSLSDLSIVSGADSRPLSFRSENQSDSSIDSEDEKILQQCIQAGMPHPKSKIPTPFNRCSMSHSVESDSHEMEQISPAKSQIPSTAPKKTPRKPPEGKADTTFQANSVVPKTAPHSSHTCGFSHGWPKSPKEQTNLSVRPKPFEHSKNRLVTAVRPLQQSPLYSSPLDTPHTYAVEGTPIVISDTSSHSSIAYEDDLQTSDSGCEKHVKSHLMESNSRSFSGVNVQETEESGSMVRSAPNCADMPGSSSPAPNVKKPFNLEGSSMTYSCNSSFSSLSVESMDELSAGEQALLEECINSGKPKSKSKARRSYGKAAKAGKKGFGKCGIPVYCGPWSNSQEGSSPHRYSGQHRNEDRLQVECQSSNEEQEEKGKEDERARENLRKGESASSWSGSEDFSKENSAAGTPQGTIATIQESSQAVPTEEAEDEDHDEMLLVVTLSPKGEEGPPEVVLMHHEPMSESLELLEEAQRLAEKVEAEAEDMTHSSISCFSDLENAKPPSVMGDLQSLSMTSSNGISEFEKGATWKKTKDGRRVVVPETVRRALAGNIDVMKTSCTSETLDNVRPPSCMGSLENLSMRSSLTFELLDNVNPPSAMDQIPRTGSCTSLNSISSDILESKSQSLADMSPNIKTSGGNSEMYERLNAAAAMVQVYSRELSTIMNGGNGNGNKSSSSTSENVIDHIQPPSIFMDIAEMTVQDGLDVITDNMASDTEMEEELPRDDETEAISSDTLRAPYLQSLAKDEHIDGSTENVSTLVEDLPLYSPRRKFNLSKLEITAEEFQTLQDDANFLVSTLHQMGKHDDRTHSSGSVDKLLEDETMSLISNESDGDQSEHASPRLSSGPRIVKPINRDSVRQMKDKGIKDVKSALFTSRLAVPKSKDASKTGRSAVVPKASPLSKKPPPFSCAPMSPKNSDSKPKSPSPQAANKTPSPKFNSNTYTKSKGRNSTSNPPSVPDSPAPAADDNRPKLIKQGTFTKDSPTHSPAKSPNAASPSAEERPAASAKNADRRMSYGGSSSSSVQNVTGNMKRNLSGANLKKDIMGNGMRNSASSRSLTRQDEGNSRGSSGNTTKRSPSTSSLGSRCESGLTGSNVSLSSNSSTGTGALRKGNKKEVPSKIACIWKKGVSRQSRSSPERTDNGAKASGKSKIVKPVTPATVRSKLSALGRKHSSS